MDIGKEDAALGIILEVRERNVLGMPPVKVEVYNGQGDYLGTLFLDDMEQVQGIADAFAAQAEWVAQN